MTLMKWIVPLMCLASVAHADSKELQRSVTVTGSCLKTLVPDRGSVVVTADALKPDLAAASANAIDTYNKTKSAVQNLKLKDLQLTTTESSFQEEKEWKKDKQISKGFRARMGLQISTSDITRLGEVLPLASKQGIQQVSGLTMSVSPEKSKQARESCLDEAVKNARSKAETIAKAAGTKVGRVLEVVEQAESNGPVYPMRNQRVFSAQADLAGAAAPTVEAGSEKMTVNVTASFSFE